MLSNNSFIFYTRDNAQGINKVVKYCSKAINSLRPSDA